MMIEINPWDQEQKRVEVPQFKRLYGADQQDMETLKQFEQEPKVEIHMELNDETDYAVINPDGSVTRVAECVTINGTRWQLVPGKNIVPKSVYELLIQREQDRKRFTPAPGGKCIGLIRR